MVGEWESFIATEQYRYLTSIQPWYTYIVMFRSNICNCVRYYILNTMEKLSPPNFVEYEEKIFDYY